MKRSQDIAAQRVDMATAWMQARGWQPHAFQRAVWSAMQGGRSGLLHASTGTGKTLAVWLGALARWGMQAGSGVQVLWITPMRALARDTFDALLAPMAELAPEWTAGIRSGDTSSSERQRQNRRLPQVLVTTPESLSLLLARSDGPSLLKPVQLVVVDEWHELLASKRGVQVQLALARLRHWQPQLMVWGMSATLGNLPEALAALLPVNPPPGATVIQADMPKRIDIHTVLPKRPERFTWAGHLGLHMLPQVVDILSHHRSSLLFTNTRSQAERWYQALLDARTDWAGQIALHHGSLSLEVRQWVESGLSQGRLRVVVCTSSLDLGVDFSPVDHVVQVGSPKSIARLLQRAGRSGHAPGLVSHISLVPTHTLEILEAAAVRQAMMAREIECRQPLKAPMDVLVQHLVTVALGGGFVPQALYEEIRTTHAYAELSPQAWQWALDFVRQGGPSLSQYPDFQRAAPDEAGVWRVKDARLARRHRSNIGTIPSESSVHVQYLSGGRLGTVEESFISRLSKGDVFLFAGRLLELVRVEQMTAWVRKAQRAASVTPRWAGGRMAWSDTLGTQLLLQFEQLARGELQSPELQAVEPLAQTQRRHSSLPTRAHLVVETLRSREGHHLFVYPFAGRQVHWGLASWMAWRAGQQQRNTFSMAANDHGFELLSAEAFDWAGQWGQVMQLPDSLEAFEAALLGSLNASEMSRRRFRDIARVAGLVFQSHPHEQRSHRQLQASASLYHDVFTQYDPDNLLLRQARDEVLSQELESRRLWATLHRMQGQTLCLHQVQQPTPLAFPLMVERFREKLSTETLNERLQRMVAALEKAEDTPMPPVRQPRKRSSRAT